MTTAELSGPVRSALATSAYAKARIVRAERESRAGVIRYEFLVAEHGEMKELTFDLAGKFLSAHEADEGEN